MLISTAIAIPAREVSFELRSRFPNANVPYLFYLNISLLSCYFGLRHSERDLRSGSRISCLSLSCKQGLHFVFDLVVVGLQGRGFLGVYLVLEVGIDLYRVCEEK